MGSGGLVTLLLFSSCASQVEEGQLQTCLPGETAAAQGTRVSVPGISLSLSPSSSHPEENHSGLPNPPLPELYVESLSLQLTILHRCTCLC